MQRSQIYLSETQLGALAAYARQRGTTHSALIREALDQYLSQQPPVDRRLMRMKAFAAWSPNPEGPSLAQLRAGERRFGR